MAAFGPQGWWPVAVGRERTPRYRPGFQGSLTERQRQEICIGAILTQNTNWGNVVKALASMAAAGIRDFRGVATLPPRRLGRLIRSSGYFRQKARKLRGFAAHALKRGPVDKWLAGPLEELREELLSLWGVGPETADSILLYAGGRPSFVVDAYTLRIGRRVGWLTARDDYESTREKLARAFPVDAGVYAEFHALLVALAKAHCRATPVCRACPLEEDCRHARARARP